MLIARTRELAPVDVAVLTTPACFAKEAVAVEEALNVRRKTRDGMQDATPVDAALFAICICLSKEATPLDVAVRIIAIARESEAAAVEVAALNMPTRLTTDAVPVDDADLMICGPLVSAAVAVLLALQACV